MTFSHSCCSVRSSDHCQLPIGRYAKVRDPQNLQDFSLEIQNRDGFDLFQCFIHITRCFVAALFSSILSGLFQSLPFIMQRTLSSASRSSLSSSSLPYSRTAGRSLQQLRYAHKELRFGVEGRAQLLKGVETLSKAVATTLGPKGRNVLIESSYGSPKITKGAIDGFFNLTLCTDTQSRRCYGCQSNYPPGQI